MEVWPLLNTSVIHYFSVAVLVLALIE
jgi:hypothetical protein